MLVFESRKPSYCEKHENLHIELGGSPTMARKASGLRSFFHLRRSPSEEKSFESPVVSPQSSKPSGLKRCKPCQIQANMVEMDFAARVACRVRVTTPSHEESPMMKLSPEAEPPAVYEPKLPGCGHGNWLVEIFDENEQQQWAERVFLSGWGCLRLHIHEDFTVSVERRDWLDSPIAVSCGY